MTAIVVVWNQKDTDMPQSVFSGIDQPAVIPATAASRRLPAEASLGDMRSMNT